MDIQKYISVQTLNKYIKAKFDQDASLRNVYITGEISNFRPHPSGHLYFTLKDDHARVSAIMFIQMQENFPLHHSSYRSDEFSPASDHQDKSIQTVPDLSIPTVFQMRPDHYLAGVPKYFASASSSNPSPITISTFCPSPTGFI